MIKSIIGALKLNSTKVLLGVLICFSQVVHAQIEIQKIRLSDHKTGTPIAFAHWVYGEQTGVTAKDGVIEVRMTSLEELQISHILYGYQYIKLKGSKQDDGVLVVSLQQLEYALQPASVISLRKNSTNQEFMEVSYKDKLTHDAGRFLEQSPVISGIRKGGNYGVDPVMRGTKYEQVNVVLDGCQSAIAACPNRMDPPVSQIAMNTINQVEILKGPHALRFGNAIGGTINFKSNQPEYTETPLVNGRISGSYEGNGQIISSEAMFGLKTKRINFDVMGALAKGGDYKSGNNTVIPASFERNSFGTGLHVKLNDYQQVSLRVTNNLGKNVEFAGLPMDLKEDDTWLYNFKYTYKGRKKVIESISATLFGAFVDHEMDNLNKPLQPRMVNAKTTANTNNYGLRAEAKLRFNNQVLYAGLDSKTEGASGERTREILMGPMAGKVLTDNVWQRSKISKTGVFTEYHFNLGRNYFIVSGRLENNIADALDLANEFGQNYATTNSNQFNPALSMGLNRKLSDRMVLGAWVARVRRSGSLSERYINHLPIGLDAYEMLGNPGIAPETNTQVDVNISLASGNGVIELSGFISYIDNYISSVIRPDLVPKMPASPGVRQFYNLDRAMQTGLELSVEHRLPLQLMVLTDMAYVFAEDLGSGLPLPEIPPLEIGIALQGEYLKGKLWPNISYRYASGQSRVNSTFGEEVTPSWDLLNLKVTYKLLTKYRLSLGVDNVLDNNYYEHLSRNMKLAGEGAIYSPGRNVYVTFIAVF